MNYYNDNDPKSAAWLRELIKQNVIPTGDVDERSIADVTGSDLKGYAQCHFFAGIGGWAEALRIAGIGSNTPLWTGSCPCQPFSCAGQGKGEKDERHLWPEFYRLIRECRPNLVFGEQVEAAIGKGWLDGVFADLETEGYTCGAAVLGAHSVGAPHIRQRLYWVADSTGKRIRKPGEFPKTEIDGIPEISGQRDRFGVVRGSGSDGRLADSERTERGPDLQQYEQHRNDAGRHETSSGLGTRCEDDFWSSSIWLPCTDGKARRIEPTIFPLVDGLPGRVGILRGSGNAICPQTAAEFIKAYFEVREGV